MPTTFIQPVVSLKTRIEYVSYGNGSEGTQRRIDDDPIRALAYESDFESRKDFWTYARSLRERTKRSYDGYEVRVSWGRDELVPEKKEDIATAMEFGRALANELFPKTPVMITAHGDGVGNCLHLHIDFINVRDIDSGLAIRGKGRNHQTVVAISDTLARERGMKVVQFQAKEGSWVDRRIELESQIDSAKERMEPGAKWSRALRENVVALHIGEKIDRLIQDKALEIKSVSDFKNFLPEYGLRVNEKVSDDGSVGWTYTAEVELEGKTRSRRCKASKVLSGFTADEIMDTIQAEAERQRAIEEEEQRQIELAKQSRLAKEEEERQSKLIQEEEEEFDYRSIEETIQKYREKEQQAEEARQKRRAEEQRKKIERAQRATTLSKIPGTRDSYQVTFDPRTIGVDKDLWTMYFSEEMLVSYAAVGEKVLQEAGKTDLHLYYQLGTIAETGRLCEDTTVENFAKRYQNQCREAVLGEWQERLPNNHRRFSERAFQRIAENDRQLRVLPTVLQFLGNVMAIAVREFQIVTRSIRERAKEALINMGAITESDFDETTYKYQATYEDEKTPIQTDIGQDDTVPDISKAKSSDYWSHYDYELIQ